ncbi:Hypothetical protein F387_00489 [Wohlfahrtiimonas chitiniclastica SH04]|uniref:Uncharacterized protein n=1 Tax=Wohlfahrtiimonas chitiniclastica SH04 TaxID=1261130 RepID=L8Y168_9GAMM|nr:Hypothetical protein F387_00489 [Wohlfahrtiimonas chitiniclastica SH04]
MPNHCALQFINQNLGFALILRRDGHLYFGIKIVIDNAKRNVAEF